MPWPAPVIKAAVFDGLAEFVGDQKLDLDVVALLSEVGLDRSALAHPDTYIALEGVSRFFERAAHLTKRPCFGLDYARAYPIGAAGSLGFVLTHAPTFEVAIAQIVRFVRVMTHPMHIELKEAGGGVGYIEWVFPLEFTAVMPQFVSFTLGAVIERLRIIAGAAWTPLRVELIHRALPCADLTRAMFGTRTTFEAAHNRMWFDPTTRALRNANADERLYRVALSAAQAELEAIEVSRGLGADSIRVRLRNHISATMGTLPPTLDAAADALGMEPRQLQYALDLLGTSYSDEVSETRRSAAENMLANTELSMTDIASALGFSELSSFTRACRELWFGMSPSKFRRRVKAEGIVSTASHNADGRSERT